MPAHSTRPTLSLRKPLATDPAQPSQAQGTDSARKPATALDPESVPVGAPVSFVNWRIGRARPTRRYLTADAALSEARRIATEDPGAPVLTYRLEIVGTNGDGGRP